MTGASAARGDRPLRLALHCRKTAWPAARRSSAPRCNFLLLPRAHGRKATGPAVRCAPALGRHGPPLGFTHGGEAARQAMVRTPAHGRNPAPQFRVHRGKTAPRLVLTVGVMASAAARCPIVLVCVCESSLAPLAASARGGKFRLPSCFCHNFPFPFFSLFLGSINFKPAIINYHSWICATGKKYRNHCNQPLLLEFCTNGISCSR